MAAAAKAAQEVLGEHQDAAIAAETLNELGHAHLDDGELCLVAGRGRCRPIAAPSPTPGGLSGPHGRPPGRRWASPVTRSVLAPRNRWIGLHGMQKCWRPEESSGEATRKLRVATGKSPSCTGRSTTRSLPKGKVDTGEQLVVTARREVCEETGAIAVCGQVVGEQRYRVATGQKYVRYWAMANCDGAFEPNQEVDELRWLSARRALRQLSYSTRPSTRAAIRGHPRRDGHAADRASCQSRENGAGRARMRCVHSTPRGSPRHPG